ncbi:MAG: hypothetical protein KatS3mg068_0056 [Candidatus Sericytochromatia bacterium]|nr:MAG: hypothetical protein KatS3mg068_0056 [Candidatus Sericytochromatia bacterium]
MTKKVGEVISSSTTSFTAQCIKQDDLNLPKAPYFGSFVICKSEDLNFDTIGIVSEIISGSIDSLHIPTAMNLSREELRLQQPQIFDLLKTEFNCITVGYLEDGKVYQYIPPHPPQIHDFVYSPDKDIIIKITQKLEYLRTLLNYSSSLSDELIAANIRYCYKLRGLDRNFIINVGREISNLLKDNYDKLSSILIKIKPE